MRLPAGLTAAFLLLSLAGCGGSGQKSDSTSTLDMTPIDPATAVTVSGVITLDGQPPAEENINTSADPVCSAQHKDVKMTTERAVVKDGKVRWAFVYVKEGLEKRGFKPPDEPVVLDQLGCRYEPHVMGAMVGQPVKLLNSDETLHNVHAMCTQAKAFNVGLAVKGMAINRKFDKPEVMVPLKCDVHSWMQAFVGVLPHPFYAVTDENGAYTIKGLPPGNYTLAVWHETFGEQTMNVTLAPSETKTADFQFKVTS